MELPLPITFRNSNQGRLDHVRIDLTVPRGELALSREPAAYHLHEDVFGDGLETLEMGDETRFEEEGEKGPQARTAVLRRRTGRARRTLSATRRHRAAHRGSRRHVRARRARRGGAGARLRR